MVRVVLLVIVSVVRLERVCSGSSDCTSGIESSERFINFVSFESDSSVVSDFAPEITRSVKSVHLLMALISVTLLQFFNESRSSFPQFPMKEMSRTDAALLMYSAFRLCRLPSAEISSRLWCPI